MSTIPHLFVLLILLAVPAAAQGGIVVSIPATVPCGSVVCVQVLSTVPLGDLKFTCELNDVAARMRVLEDADGMIVVCIDVPLAAAGGNLTITVTGGGYIGTGSATISQPPSGG